ncbi:MAG TPA: hypothetical protein DHW42_00280 [Candidatus Marinimicrobia bacterium]|nr:hypothetical protein [Candidatus Neomarinimicrobiota bacterium]
MLSKKNIPVLMLFILLFFNCDNFLNNKNEKRGPREYRWSVDTLQTGREGFQIVMEDIWGNSSKDIYVIGQGDLDQRIYHYDGKEWKPINLGIDAFIIDSRSIFGFSSDDVYGAGAFYGDSVALITKSAMIHYDGSQWSDIDLNDGGRGLLDMWGISPDDIWAGGIEGTLFHYNGVEWTKLAMPDSLWFKKFSGFASDDVYAIAYYPNPNTFIWTYYIIHWDGKDWSVQDKFSDGMPETFGSHGLEVIDDYLYSAGDGVFRKRGDDTEWEKILTQPAPRFYDIYGTSPDNIFVVGKAGRAYHYNGIDWYLYEEIQYPDIEYTGVWTDGKEVFIVGEDNSKSFIMHGK